MAHLGLDISPCVPLYLWQLVFLVHAHSGGCLRLINHLVLGLVPAGDDQVIEIRPLLHETMTLRIGVHRLIAMLDAIVFTAMRVVIFQLETLVFACCIPMASVSELLKPHPFILI